MVSFVAIAWVSLEVAPFFCYSLLLESTKCDEFIAKTWVKFGDVEKMLPAILSK